MIEKHIHFAWLGNNEIPEIMKHGLNSAPKIVPEYKITLHTNNSSAELINEIKGKSEFFTEAFNTGRWVAALDYMRMYIIYHYGGIYLDMDTEILKTFDPYLKHSFFSSVDWWPQSIGWRIDNRIDKAGNVLHRRYRPLRRGVAILGGAFAAEPGHPLLKACLEAYDLSNEGLYYDLLCLRTSGNYIMADEAVDLGFRYRDEYQQLFHNTHIYPSDYFANRAEKTDNSVTIHYCAYSWGKK